MPTVPVNITIEEEVKKGIDALKEHPKESRSFSKMCNILLKEALEARKSKTKKR